MEVTCCEQEWTDFGRYNSQQKHVEHYRSTVEEERQHLHVVCTVFGDGRDAEICCDGMFEF